MSRVLSDVGEVPCLRASGTPRSPGRRTVILVERANPCTGPESRAPEGQRQRAAPRVRGCPCGSRGRLAHARPGPDSKRCCPSVFIETKAGQAAEGHPDLPPTGGRKPRGAPSTSRRTPSRTWRLRWRCSPRSVTRSSRRSDDVLAIRCGRPYRADEASGRSVDQLLCPRPHPTGLRDYGADGQIGLRPRRTPMAVWSKCSARFAGSAG